MALWQAGRSGDQALRARPGQARTPARAGSVGRGEGAGRSARRAPGVAPISPSRHAPRIPAAPRHYAKSRYVPQGVRVAVR